MCAYVCVGGTRKFQGKGQAVFGARAHSESVFPGAAACAAAVFPAAPSGCLLIVRGAQIILLSLGGRGKEGRKEGALPTPPSQTASLLAPTAAHDVSSGAASINARVRAKKASMVWRNWKMQLVGGISPPLHIQIRCLYVVGGRFCCM